MQSANTRHLLLLVGALVIGLIALYYLSRVGWLQKLLDRVIQYTLERTGMVRALERKFNGGTAGQGAIAAGIAVVPVTAAATAIWWALDAVNPFAGLAFNVLALYVLMGFRRFSHAVSAIVAAFKEGDLVAARRALGSWRGRVSSELGSGDVARIAIERGLVEAYRPRRRTGW